MNLQHFWRCGIHRMAANKNKVLYFVRTNEMDRFSHSPSFSLFFCWKSKINWSFGKKILNTAAVNGQAKYGSPSLERTAHSFVFFCLLFRNSHSSSHILFFSVFFLLIKPGTLIKTTGATLSNRWNGDVGANVYKSYKWNYSHSSSNMTRTKNMLVYFFFIFLGALFFCSFSRSLALSFSLALSLHCLVFFAEEVWERAGTNVEPRMRVYADVFRWP